MRMIGHLDSGVKARSFSDYLTVKGIENQVEPEKDGTWVVWIHSEEQLEWAKKLLWLFQQNPADPMYQSATRAAEELREQKKKEQLEYEKRVKQRRHLFRPLTAYGFGPVTFVLIFISVAVYVMSSLGEGQRLSRLLSISNMDLKGVEDLSLVRAFLARVSAFNVVLPEIRAGQVWRLFTPIFIHFTFLHIFFNMLWLRDLGSMIEARQSSWLLLIQVAVFAALSDVGQYLVTGGGFGGMSGVVYGLLGYIWIRGKYDPGSGLYLHSSTITMMIIWFFVCLIGFMGPIANTAHGLGLLTGMAWGFISSLRHR
jgi:GlpG protein